MSELLRAVMVECAELARAGRTPAPFYGCAQAAGGGAAMGIVQPPIAVAPRPADTGSGFLGPVIVYVRHTDPEALVLPKPEQCRRPTPRQPAAIRRVA